MKLTQQEEHRRIRGLQAKEFLKGEFFQTYLLPYLDKDRLEQYPDPSQDQWENKYRLAWAKDEVYTRFINTLTQWSVEADEMNKRAEEEEKSVTEA